MLNLSTNSDGGADLKSSRSRPRILFVVLYVLAGVIVLGAVCVLAGYIWQAIKNNNGELVFRGLGVGLALLTLGAIEFLLALHLKMRVEAEVGRHGAEAVRAGQARGEIGVGASVGGDLESRISELVQTMGQMTQLLREINENTLLDEEGRRAKFELLADQQRKAMFVEVDRLVREREWARAKTLLEGLLIKYPGNADVQQKMNRLEELRKQAFNEDLNRTKKAIHDLIAISAWDKAADQAETLLEKHPEADEAKELVAYVSAERQRFRQEQLKRISAEIQRNIARKRWTDALQAGRQLIEKYPDSVEAEAVRNQLKTLEENAEIETRQHLEEQIKDLVRRRSFVQAVELAKHVIATYPNSPQARALTGQLAELEKRARQQEDDIPI